MKKAMLIVSLIAVLVSCAKEVPPPEPQEKHIVNSGPFYPHKPNPQDTAQLPIITKPVKDYIRPR